MKGGRVRSQILRFSVCMFLLGSFADSSQREPVSSPAAIELWERMIHAKGGREKLSQITNILTVDPRPRAPERPSFVDLFVFPNRLWSWSDNGQSVLGVSLWVFSESSTWSADYSPRNRDKYGTTRGPSNTLLTEARLLEAHEHLLLETKWLKPVPLRVEVGRIGREQFDVVVANYAQTGGWEQVQFYVDRQTSLVRRVRRSRATVDLEGYKPVGGIMMPSVLILPGGRRRSSEYQFNVAYDPEIFSREPSLDDGPNGWKLRPSDPRLLPRREPTTESPPR